MSKTKKKPFIYFICFFLLSAPFPNSCLLLFLPALVAVVLLTGRCRGSADNDKSRHGVNATTTTTLKYASEQFLSPSPLPPRTEYPANVAASPLPVTANETAAGGKPSKFDEHVEDWQYVDDPLKNVTVASATMERRASSNNNNNNATASVSCKICALAKTKPRRNKRNHDVWPLFKTGSSKTSRHVELYAELMMAAAAAASSHSNRRKRFRRSAATAVATYPTNGIVHPYARYHHHYHNHHVQQSQQYATSLAADLQQQQNRRRRYRYAAADPYLYKRNAAATAWDKSAEFRRRYLRFPPVHDAPPPAYNNNNHHPWSPSAAALPPSQQQPTFAYLPQYPVQQQQPLPPPPPQLLSQQPAMGPRSPRLVFRDPVDQGTLQAPFGAGPNGLQDLLLSSPPDDVKGQCRLFYAVVINIAPLNWPPPPHRVRC